MGGETYEKRKGVNTRTAAVRRRYPIGAEPHAGGVHFRVWAPRCRDVAVRLVPEGIDAESNGDDLEMTPEEGGYFSLWVEGAQAGWRYGFVLDGAATALPDPASRFQRDGPHGLSEVIDPLGFEWTDSGWAGAGLLGQAIYEMHVGTFTWAGTWAAAAAELGELQRLGITLIELMPVSEFPGHFGWGYDGVDLFAPTRLYGPPDDFRAFVDRAHALGIGVILDVVYNHVGPDGNYLENFSEDYFTDRYKNEWGEAINFDGPNSGAVREFFVTNAEYWIQEFHLDGLRLDATQQIFDSSDDHILAVISRAARKAADGRAIYLVGENEPQDTFLLRACDQGGCGLDSLWNDDFHHSAMVALTGRKEAYYSDYLGRPQEFISAAKYGYLYQGQWYRWQKKPRGTGTRGLEPARFVTFIQNHDQVANSLDGRRIHRLTSPGKLRAMTALMLLGPGTPMLFQGQEFAASSPFFYFADHNPELAKAVSKGRRDFLSQFPSIAAPESLRRLVEPGLEQTFTESKLDFSERETHGEIYRLHRDLLALRRKDPVFRSQGRGGLDGAVLSEAAFVLRLFGEAEGTGDRLLLINLGIDLELSPVPEPLLAPMDGHAWRLAWSSESPDYGGTGMPALALQEVWRLPAESAIVLISEANEGGGWKG